VKKDEKGMRKGFWGRGEGLNESIRAVKALEVSGKRKWGVLVKLRRGEGFSLKSYNGGGFPDIVNKEEALLVPEAGKTILKVRPSV